MVRLTGAVAAVCLATLLAACDGGASAVPVHQAAVMPATDVEAATPSPSRAATARAAPVRRIDGRPMWSASRRFTADQNAERNFRRNGAAFGAATLEAYVARAHAFVARPPKGSQILTRTNGDTLIYDPAGNVFAVATREGAPRTMFKPDDGPAYWARVKAREAEGGARRKRDDG